MITEPIQPNDHSVSPDNKLSYKTLALLEAIKQTFERDAEYLDQLEAYETDLAVYNADPHTERSDESGFFKIGDTSDADFHERPTKPVRKPDPEGELWQSARLIVDGEYRRRRGEGS